MAIPTTKTRKQSRGRLVPSFEQTPYFQEFMVSFGSEALGMEVQKVHEMPVVRRLVRQNKRFVLPAERGGVTVACIIVGVAGVATYSMSYKEVLARIKQASRPLEITFRRLHAVRDPPPFRGHFWQGYLRMFLPLRSGTTDDIIIGSSASVILEDLKESDASSEEITEAGVIATTSGRISGVNMPGTAEMQGHWTGRFYILRANGELQSFAGPGDEDDMTKPIETFDVIGSKVLVGDAARVAAINRGLFLSEIKSSKFWEEVFALQLPRGSNIQPGISRNSISANDNYSVRLGRLEASKDATQYDEKNNQIMHENNNYYDFKLQNRKRMIFLRAGGKERRAEWILSLITLEIAHGCFDYPSNSSSAKEKGKHVEDPMAMLWPDFGFILKQGFVDKHGSDRALTSPTPVSMLSSTSISPAQLTHDSVRIKCNRWNRVWLMLLPGKGDRGARLLWFRRPPMDATEVPAGQLLLWGVQVCILPGTATATSPAAKLSCPSSEWKDDMKIQVENGFCDAYKRLTCKQECIQSSEELTEKTIDVEPHESKSTFVLHAGTRTVCFHFDSMSESLCWQCAINAAAKDGFFIDLKNVGMTAIHTENDGKDDEHYRNSSMSHPSWIHDVNFCPQPKHARFESSQNFKKLLLSFRLSPEKILCRPDVAFSCMVGGHNRLYKSTGSGQNLRLREFDTVASSVGHYPCNAIHRSNEVLRKDFTAIAGQYFLPVCDAFCAHAVFDALTVGTTVADHLGGGTNLFPASSHYSGVVKAIGVKNVQSPINNSKKNMSHDPFGMDKMNRTSMASQLGGIIGDITEGLKGSSNVSNLSVGRRKNSVFGNNILDRCTKIFAAEPLAIGVSLRKSIFLDYCRALEQVTRPNEMWEGLRVLLGLDPVEVLIRVEFKVTISGFTSLEDETSTTKSRLSVDTENNQTNEDKKKDCDSKMPFKPKMEELIAWIESGTLFLTDRHLILFSRKGGRVNAALKNLDSASSVAGASVRVIPLSTIKDVQDKGRDRLTLTGVKILKIHLDDKRVYEEDSSRPSPPLEILPSPRNSSPLSYQDDDSLRPDFPERRSPSSVDVNDAISFMTSDMRYRRKCSDNKHSESPSASFQKAASRIEGYSGGLTSGIILSFSMQTYVPSVFGSSSSSDSLASQELELRAISYNRFSSQRSRASRRRQLLKEAIVELIAAYQIASRLKNKHAKTDSKIKCLFSYLSRRSLNGVKVVSNQSRCETRTIGLALRRAWRLGLWKIWRRQEISQFTDAELWEVDVASRRLSLWAAANLKRRWAIMRCTGRPASTLLICTIAERAERMLKEPVGERIVRDSSFFKHLYRPIFGIAFDARASVEKKVLYQRLERLCNVGPSHKAVHAVQCLLDNRQATIASTAAPSDDFDIKTIQTSMGKSFTRGNHLAHSGTVSITSRADRLVEHQFDTNNSSIGDNTNGNGKKEHEEQDDEGEGETREGYEVLEPSSLKMHYAGWMSGLISWLTHREERCRKDKEAKESKRLSQVIPTFQTSCIGGRSKDETRALMMAYSEAFNPSRFREEWALFMGFVDPLVDNIVDQIPGTAIHHLLYWENCCFSGAVLAILILIACFDVVYLVPSFVIFLYAGFIILSHSHIQLNSIFSKKDSIHSTRKNPQACATIFSPLSRLSGLKKCSTLPSPLRSSIMSKALAQTAPVTTNQRYSPVKEIACETVAVDNYMSGKACCDDEDDNPDNKNEFLALENKYKSKRLCVPDLQQSIPAGVSICPSDLGEEVWKDDDQLLAAAAAAAAAAAIQQQQRSQQGGKYQSIIGPSIFTNSSKGEPLVYQQNSITNGESSRTSHENKDVAASDYNLNFKQSRTPLVGDIGEKINTTYGVTSSPSQKKAPMATVSATQEATGPTSGDGSESLLNFMRQMRAHLGRMQLHLHRYNKYFLRFYALHMWRDSPSTVFFLIMLFLVASWLALIPGNITFALVSVYAFSSPVRHMKHYHKGDSPIVHGRKGGVYVGTKKKCNTNVGDRACSEGDTQVHQTSAFDTVLYHWLDEIPLDAPTHRDLSLLVQRSLDEMQRVEAPSS